MVTGVIQDEKYGMGSERDFKGFMDYLGIDWDSKVKNDLILILFLLIVTLAVIHQTQITLERMLTSTTVATGFHHLFCTE